MNAQWYTIRNSNLLRNRCEDREPLPHSLVLSRIWKEGREGEKEGWKEKTTKVFLSSYLPSAAESSYFPFSFLLVISYLYTMHLSHIYSLWLSLAFSSLADFTLIIQPVPNYFCALPPTLLPPSLSLSFWLTSCLGSNSCGLHLSVSNSHGTSWKQGFTTFFSEAHSLATLSLTQCSLDLRGAAWVLDLFHGLSQLLSYFGMPGITMFRILVLDYLFGWHWGIEPRISCMWGNHSTTEL